MRFLFATVLLFCPTVAYAITPNDEVRIAIEFLEGVPEHDRTFVRFFSFNSIPDAPLVNVISADGGFSTLNQKQAALKVLSFWIHSMSGGQNFRQPVHISDNIFWIDIRNYGWTEEAFEKISLQDPYYREPWVDPGLYTVLRVRSANAILRADWFIVHTADVMKQNDRGIKDPFYYELLYASFGIPKNIEEFRLIWEADVDSIEKELIAKGTVVDSGESQVSRHNRQLWRGRTIYGYYWETQDVLNAQDKKDYVENVVPGLRKADEFDAGEVITNNKLGLQVYFLLNNQGNRIEFGDNGVVADNSDAHDKRVRTAVSCVNCHAYGINPASNAIKDLLKSGLELKYHNPDDAEKTERFYLDSEFDQLIKDDQELYRRAIRKCNNLSPQANQTLFKTLIDRYEQDLTIEQAALECGVTVDEFKAKMGNSIRGRVGGLLKGRNIPRDAWESPINGAFAECILTLDNLPFPQEQPKVETPKAEPQQVLQPAQNPLMDEIQQFEQDQVEAAMEEPEAQPKTQPEPKETTQQPVEQPTQEPEIPKPKPPVYIEPTMKRAIVITAPAKVYRKSLLVGEIPVDAIINVDKEVESYVHTNYNNIEGWVSKKNINKLE